MDESSSLYAFPAPIPDSILITEGEASEPERIREEEAEFGTLEESPISFWLSRPNERQSRNDLSDEEPASNGDSVMHSPRPKLRRLLPHKEKVKKKMPKYDTYKEKSDQSESDIDENEDEPSEMKPESAKKALKSTYKKLCQSTRE